jgi:predicted nucleotide-binding protein
VLRPWAEGTPITLAGKSIPVDQILKITIKETAVGVLFDSANGDWFRNAKDVTDEFITEAPGSSVIYRGSVQADIPPATDTRDVFVVHGRNAAARDALFEFLRSLDLHPLEWSQAVELTGKPMPYIGEILDAAFSHAHAIVVLLTPDDEARLREPFTVPGDPPHELELTGQARPNVLFEAGMAMSRDSERTILVELGNLRPFTDISGIHTIRFDNSTQRRQELASRLISAGCPANLSGTAWHTAGDFTSAMELVHSNEFPEQNIRAATISHDAKQMLIAAVQIRNGAIMKISSQHGSVFVPTPPTIMENDPGRLSARLQQALEELIEQGLVTDGPPFNVTHKGYLTADDFDQ